MGNHMFGDLGLKETVARLSSAQRLLLILVVCILVVIGSLAVTLGEWYATVVLLVVAIVALVLVFTLLPPEVPKRSDSPPSEPAVSGQVHPDPERSETVSQRPATSDAMRHPLSERIPWDNEYPSLEGLKGVLDGTYRAEASHALAHNDDPQWLELYQELGEGRAESTKLAIVRLLRILRDEHKAEFARMLFKNREVFPQTICAASIREEIEQQMSLQPPSNVKEAFTTLYESLEWCDERLSKFSPTGSPSITSVGKQSEAEESSSGSN